MSKAKHLAKAIREEGNNYYFSPSLRQLVDAVLLETEEEKELREWKAKARPFLEFVRVDYLCNSKKIEDSLDRSIDKAFYRERNEQAIKTLTELLGE